MQRLWTGALIAGALSAAPARADGVLKPASTGFSWTINYNGFNDTFGVIPGLTRVCIVHASERTQWQQGLDLLIHAE